MKKRIVLWALFVVASSFGGDTLPPPVFAVDPAPAAAPATPPRVSTLDNQTNVSLTIYNSNLGLVKDVRDIDLGEGEQELRFMDVASEVIPTTVHVKSLTDARGLQVLEQNYEYDLISPEKLLEKYVGKEVKILDKNYYTGQDQLTTATLLSANGSPVYQTDNEIHVGLPGRVILPQLPENLLSKPTLVWLLRGGKAGKHTIEASYLTNQITWSADYIVVLNADDTQADLSGWVSIDNKSGATYKNATLKLVAGDVHRVQPKAVMYQRALAMADAAAPEAKQFTEEGFFEYHLYTLDRPATVKSNQTKQMTLLSAASIPVVKRFTLQGQQGYFMNPYSSADELPPEKVSVTLEIENAQKHNLGLPLPKGTVRVYKADKEGSLQFTGEDSIDHTVKDELVKVKMGEAFDVTGRRKQTDFKQIARGVTEIAWEITLRNHKPEPVTVRVNEPLFGDWEVLSASLKYEKADAHTLRFDVPVPKDGEVKVTYRIRIKTM
ncbi:MAG: DUF4139 domain-containing protein [Deltaproteobacteria bacterium]|nr:DUF4139 domain-containing protein [Deltaproteobacteria bacterium]